MLLLDLDWVLSSECKAHSTTCPTVVRVRCATLLIWLEYTG